MAKFGEWIPVTYRDRTPEELQAIADKLGTKPENLYSCDKTIYTCETPEDEQEVIITTYQGGVFMTIFYKDTDNGEYFECFDRFGEVLAWMPAPEPFSNSEVDNDNQL